MQSTYAHPKAECLFVAAGTLMKAQAKEWQGSDTMMGSRITMHLPLQISLTQCCHAGYAMRGDKQVAMAGAHLIHLPRR